MRRTPRYIYQRTGGPLVTWDRIRPPGQSRAADTTALGSLGSTDVFNQPRRLPRGGAPEYINDGFSGVGGCGCGMGDAEPGTCSCTSGKTVTIGQSASLGILALTAVGALAVLKKLLT